MNARQIIRDLLDLSFIERNQYSELSSFATRNRQTQETLSVPPTIPESSFLETKQEYFRI